MMWSGSSSIAVLNAVPSVPAEFVASGWPS